MKVLIADTAVETKQILGKMLTDEGYECCFVEEGGDVLGKVYSESPDVLFLSVNATGGRCFGVLEKLKSAPSTVDMPVILISAGRAQKRLSKGYLLGAYDYICRPYFKEEVIARLKNITYIRNKTRELEFAMDRDCLTGLYNRGFFMDRLVEELSWSLSYGEPLSLMMLDIDFFKKINDTYGHRCGDEVLAKIAKIVLSTVRRNDIAGRYGGEEFIVMMSNTSSDTAAAVGERARQAVQDAELLCDGSPLSSVTISIGVATFETGDPAPEALIRQADRALYMAKEGGRNRVCVHTDGSRPDA